MLSGECAMGKYPVECVEAMDRIATRIENDINYWKRFEKKNYKIKSDDFEGNIAYSTCMNAKNVEAKAIVAFTGTGNSVRRISGIGPQCPVFAITTNEKVYNQLSVVWNVFPVLVEEQETIEKCIEKGIEALKADKMLEDEDIVVVSGGSKILPDSDAKSKVVGGILKV